MKNAMVKIIKKPDKAELILMLLIVFQIVCLFAINIFHTRYLANYDSSMCFVELQQILKQKTLFIEDYYYNTNLTWDMPVMLAIPFYALTGDVFLSCGIANNIVILLFVWIIVRICKHMEVSRKGMLITVLAIFTLYDYRDLGYGDILFINGAYYGLRVFFSLCLIDVLLCIYKKLKCKSFIVPLVVSYIGFFLAGAASGIFLVGCVILPLILFVFWDILGKSEKIKICDFFNAHMLVAFGATVFSGMGIAWAKVMGYGTLIKDSKMIMPAEKMASNFANSIVGIFQLFGWSREQVSLTSAEGLVSIICFFVACAILMSFGLMVCVGIKKIRADRGNIQSSYIILTMFIVVTNAVLFLLVELTYSSATFEFRYWITALVPVILCVGPCYDYLKEKLTYNYRIVIVFMFVLALFGINLYKDYKVWGWGNGDDLYQEIMDTAEEEELDVVFVYADWYRSRTICSYASRDIEVFAAHNYSVDDTNGYEWIANRLTMTKWGSYVKYLDDCLALAPELKVGIVVADCIGEDKQFLERRAKEKIVFGTGDFELLLMDQNYMDFEYGIPKKQGECSKDFFNWGYEKTNIYLNEDGCYQSNGQEGLVLQGTFPVEEEGVFSATLNYHLMCGTAQIEIEVADKEGKITRYRETLSEAADQTVINEVKVYQGDTYTVKIMEEKGTKIQFNNIIYERQ